MKKKDVRCINVWIFVHFLLFCSELKACSMLQDCSSTYWSLEMYECFLFYQISICCRVQSLFKLSLLKVVTHVFELHIFLQMNWEISAQFFSNLSWELDMSLDKRSIFQNTPIPKLPWVLDTQFFISCGFDSVTNKEKLTLYFCFLKFKLNIGNSKHKCWIQSFANAKALT